MKTTFLKNSISPPSIKYCIYNYINLADDQGMPVENAFRQLDIEFF